MDKTTISFKVPFNYPMCLKSECAQAATCLRQIAMAHTPAKQEYFNIINPSLVKPSTGQCNYYRRSTKVLFGKGFQMFFDELPRKQGRIFAASIIDQFNRRDYFYMRKGEKLISPARQKILQRLLAKTGSTLPLAFDSYIEDYEW